MVSYGGDPGLPPGMSTGDAIFYDRDCCPECGMPVDDLPRCEECNAVLDPDEAETA